jgi:predicted DNA-binding transcriptional regulator YafY
MPKNDNMLAILWMLSSNKKITAKQIAEKLELNIRTVYRYIDSLITSGVPIISDSGHNGGYSLMNDFHQAPLVFDIEEKKALLYATTHAKDSGYPFSDALSSAIEKLKLYSTEEQERILSRHIEGFEVAKQRIAPELKVSLEALTLSIASEQSVEIEYRTKREENHQSRIIDPYGILYWSNKWYMVGFCHLRGEIRSFRVERIIKMTHTEGTFVRPKDFSAKAFFLRSLMPDKTDDATIVPLVITGKAEALDVFSFEGEDFEPSCIFNRKQCAS